MRPHEFDEQYDDTWRYERFITTIEQRAGISWEKAERAARATLETLGERIAWGEARDLAADLPGEIGEWLLQPGGDAEPFDVEEFVRRVAAREGVDTDTAERHARAVFVALARLVRSDEMAEALAQLPKEYGRLVGGVLQRRRDPGGPEVLPYEEFVDRVSGRAGLEPAAAARAIDAVLETLAERIAGGEVDDIAAALPVELRPALKHGRDRSRGHAQKMSLDDFVARVADRERVTWEDALEHTRAVLVTLREALPDQEWSDMLQQLPRAYHEALLEPV
ncbi:MAG: hypothetical protein QOD65_1128 [Gaiellales bacterium]|nr:hypothetical protein [Gaiellales bacterium]